VGVANGLDLRIPGTHSEFRFNPFDLADALIGQLHPPGTDLEMAFMLEEVQMPVTLVPWPGTAYHSLKLH